MYTIRAGDTLETIAEEFGMLVDDLVALNSSEGNSNVVLVEGERIVAALTPISPIATLPETVPKTSTVAIPPPTPSDPNSSLYVVESGDTLMSIAQTLNMLVDPLFALNDWPGGIDHVVSPGDRIRVPRQPGMVRTDTDGAVDIIHSIQVGDAIEIPPGGYPISN